MFLAVLEAELEKVDEKTVGRFMCGTYLDRCEKAADTKTTP
jgi:hypothetical protein